MSITDQVARGKGILFRMTPDRLGLDFDRIEDSDCRLWLVLSFIGRFRGYVTSTDHQLADRMRRSPQSIQRSLMRLERAGFLRRSRGDDGARRIELNPDGGESAGTGIQVVG